MPTAQQLISGLAVNIPNGAHDLGPASLPDALTAITIHLARCTTATPTVWPNASTTIAVTLFISGDGGVTWQNIGGFTAAGGILLKSLDNSERAETTYFLQTALTSTGTSRQVKVTVTVTGGPLISTVTLEAA